MSISSDGQVSPDIPSMAAIDEVETDRKRLRASARAAVGVTGDEASPPLRRAIKSSGVGWYPLIAIGLLHIASKFQGYGFFVLGPNISQALGLSAGGLAALVSLKLICNALAELPTARLVQRRPRRGLISVATGFGWSIVTVLTGFVTTPAALLGVLAVDGAQSASVDTLHQPLLVDTYPPTMRVRGLSFYRAMDQFGNVASPLLVALLTSVFLFTWRGVFLVMGGVSFVLTLVCIRLRDPGRGRWDTAKVQEAVRSELAQGGASGVADNGSGSQGALASGQGGQMAADDPAVALGFFEVIRRVLLIPTVRRLLISQAVLGMFYVPFSTFLFFYLADRWSLDASQRGFFYAMLSLFAVGALYLLGRRGDSLFRADPAKILRLNAAMIVCTMISLALAVASPWFWLMVICFGINAGFLSTQTPLLASSLLSIVHPSMRAHVAALGGLAFAAVGGLGGLILLEGVDTRFGYGVAIGVLAIPGLFSAVIMYRASRGVNADLDRMLDDVVEHEEVRDLMAAGHHFPMLVCRHTDFYYGSVQVLFDVSFAVDAGEMVALLGTNGAGKSTLLRVISGLGVPTRGSVRWEGADITFLDAERRLRLGIAQVDGGHAVFGPLSVVENLRVFGYSYGKDRRSLESGIEASLEAFPALAAYRNRPAATLSGGQQQMLALSKALIVKPRLLIIDELSLGLAPVVVEQLLQMVRRINATGSSVVLVEQSVNVALSLAEHAYFMEKGEIRFDGRAADLLERRDLLRSVFLEGASAAVHR
jgi:ABC-type branched-subunit amino acid transport system ATPase component